MKFYPIMFSFDDTNNFEEAHLLRSLGSIVKANFKISKYEVDEIRKWSEKNHRKYSPDELCKLGYAIVDTVDDYYIFRATNEGILHYRNQLIAFLQRQREKITKQLEEHDKLIASVIDGSLF